MSQQVALVAVLLVFTAFTSDARAQPTGAHPRALLDADVVAAWGAMANVPSSAVGRAITKCTDAHDAPGDYADGQYQGFAWVEALGACLVAHRATDLPEHAETAITYLMALLDDRTTVGDGLGPSYNDGVGIVSQDSGYSMRTHGVFAALGYDWLHDQLTSQQRATAHTRFVQWIAFHQAPDTYQRAQPGANYHAGHLLAMTLIAIAHADEMNAIDAGSGTTLWNYVVQSMWGDVMAEGYGDQGPLRGGDWLEGWQYGPLSVVSYALAGRAMIEQGVAVPWLADWHAETLDRYVHGLSPDDRWFVGGDTGDEAPMLAPNPLPLYGIIAGHAADAVRAEARAELARLEPGSPGDFTLFHEALAEAADVEPTPIDRTTLPTGYLAAGAGNYYARTRHDDTATWLVSQCRGIVVDHQHVNAGNVVISRGADALLVDPGPYGSLSTLTGNAPTMAQPHFNANYQPSQGAFGAYWGGDAVPADEATRFVFARGTESGVHATRCDYTGQFRFRDVPSPILSSATRDVVALPGETGMTMVLVDRVRTTAAYAQDPAPLSLRFRAPTEWSVDGARATATVGGSKLVARRVIGDAETSLYDVPVEDCTGDRGKCRAGRFESYEWSVSADGPSPFVVHTLDADAVAADAPPVTTVEQGAVRIVDVHRETRRFSVVVSADAAPVTSYEVDATPRTHVVLDPPAGARVRVTSTPVAAGCAVTLAPDPMGFVSEPLVFTVNAACEVEEDSSEPPRVPPPPPEPPSSGSGGGCGCDVGGARATGGIFISLFLTIALHIRRRRS